MSCRSGVWQFEEPQVKQTLERLRRLTFTRWAAPVGGMTAGATAMATEAGNDFAGKGEKEEGGGGGSKADDSAAGQRTEEEEEEGGGGPEPGDSAARLRSFLSSFGFSATIMLRTTDTRLVCPAAAPNRSAHGRL